MPSYEDLEARIIDTGECTVCGACILACPSFHVKFTDGRPKRLKRSVDCVGCSICYDACYVLRHSLIKDIEGSVIGRGKRESTGSFRRATLARTQDVGIAGTCQDGGIVSTLLLYALDSGVIDGALVVGRDGWVPVERIAKTREDILSAAGTKYGVVPVLRALRAAVVDHGMSNVCVVGSPCHIQSIRYLKYKGLPLASSVSLAVGLFCRENYEYAGIAEKARAYGLDMEMVKRLDVRDTFEIYSDGRKVSLDITEVKSCVPRHCLVCQDFAAELADIAVGSDISNRGWCTVIIRTEEGDGIFAGMEQRGLVETRSMEDLCGIEEIAHRKKEKGKQTGQIFRLSEEGLDASEIASKLGIAEERVSHRLERATDRET